MISSVVGSLVLGSSVSGESVVTFSFDGSFVRGALVVGGAEVFCFLLSVVGNNLPTEEEIPSSFEDEVGLIFGDALIRVLKLDANTCVVVGMTATLVLDKITLDAEGLKEVCRDDCSLTLDTTYRKIKKRALIMLQKIPPPSHTHVGAHMLAEVWLAQSSMSLKTTTKS